MNQEKPPKPTEGRRASKPLMEKRRRARINQSLAELKTLVLEAVKKDTSPHSKLEKADILEMTVRHLRQLQARPYQDNDASYITRAQFRAGYNHCANEVARFITTENIDATLRMRIMNHLANTLSVSSDNGYINKEPSIKNNIECSISDIDCTNPCNQVRLYQAQSRHLANIAPSRDVAVVAPSVQIPSGNSSPSTVTIPQNTANNVNVSNMRVVNGGQLAVIVQQGQGVNLPFPVIPVYAANMPTNNATPNSSTFANTHVLVPTIVYAANNQVQQQTTPSVALPIATAQPQHTRPLSQGAPVQVTSPIVDSHAGNDQIDRRDKHDIIPNEQILTSHHSKMETFDDFRRINGISHDQTQRNVWRPFEI